MPPQPVTPSPHRFVVKKEAAPRRTPLAQAHTPRLSTQQFNATPRFTVSSTPRPIVTQAVPSPAPSAARFSTPGPKLSKAQDAIQDSSNDVRHDLHNSIEVDGDDADLRYESSDDEDEYILEERTPKRRRVTSPLIEEGDEEPDLLSEEAPHTEQQDNLSSSLPILSSPPAPKRTTASIAPRFLLSTPLPPSTPQPTRTPQTNFLKPPRFRPPHPSEATQTSDPLPEQFSPHRKGQKYVPGGLAAEVRDWLVNIESSIPSPKNRDEPWIVKIMIDEMSGGGRAGMTMIRGRQVHDAGNGEGMLGHLGVVRIMLAGEGQGTGVQRGPNVEVGKMVGIKGPVWEVLIEGVKWGVGVDWKVLN